MSSTADQLRSRPISLIGLALTLQPVQTSAIPEMITTAAAAEQFPDSADISESDIEAYAKANMRVDEITGFWENSIQRSSAPDVLRGVRDSEIKIAIEVEGLSLERYRELASMIEEDDDLQNAVEAISR